MTTPKQPPLTVRHILHLWWPLAASWLLMTAEHPLVGAAIARLPDPEVNLAAWGIVFSLSIIIQGPSAMILAASTALSKDKDSYRQVRRYMLGITLLLTFIHILLAFTPLFDLVVRRLIGVPPEIVEPIRLGLMIMTPWTFGTAYRRCEQGVLIRFDQSRVVVWGSILRLSMDGLVLLLAVMIGGLPGIVVGASAIIVAVISEAAYTAWRARPVVRHRLPRAESNLTLAVFLNFYLPLALTMLLTMLVRPMVSAALSRMPAPLQSLAVWPVVFGFLIMWQSMGIGYNETVIALLDKPQAVRVLRRFTTGLAVATTLLLLVIAATPLGAFWFDDVAALPEKLVPLARQGLWIAFLLPGLRVLQSWYQGALVYSHRTRGVTESVIISLLTTALILVVGVLWGHVPGIYLGLFAVLSGFVTQTLWLRQRGRPALKSVQAGDASLQAASVPA